MNQQHPYHTMFLNQTLSSNIIKPQPQSQSPHALIPSLSQSQSQQRLASLYSSNSNQLLTLSGKLSPPSDYDVEPTKRLRVTSQEFSQTPIKIQDNFIIKPMSQRVEDLQTKSSISLDYLKQQLKLTESAMKGFETYQDKSMEVIEDPLMKLVNQDRLKGDQDLQKLAQLRQQLALSSKLEKSSDLSSSLMMGYPQLGYSQEFLEMYKAQYLENLMSQQLAQQTQQQWLERQQAEHRAQQQLLQQFQQQQMDLMMHQNLASQMQRRLQFEEAQRAKITTPVNKGISNLYQNLTMSQSDFMQNELIPTKNTLSNDDGVFKKLLERPEKSQSPLKENKSTEESTGKNSPYEYITDRSARNSQEGVEEKEMVEENQAAKKVNRQQAKKKKPAYNFSSVMSIAALNEIKKEKEPRKVNRWQLKTQQESGMLVEGQETVNVVPVQNVKEAVEPKKRGKQQPVPEVEDPNKDWRGLLGVTITRDPQYDGTDLENKKFIVIDHHERMNTLRGEDGEAPIDTKLGKSYQAVIPEISNTNSRTKNTKKRCELVWNPKAIDEREVERYFEDLSKLLGEGSINEEKALKLLKRKNYKRDKVRVNISKNEKFYSSFLVVSAAGKEANQEEIAVENGAINEEINNNNII